MRFAVSSAVGRHSSKSKSLPPSALEEDLLHEEVWLQLRQCQQGGVGTHRETEAEADVSLEESGSGSRALLAIPTGMPIHAERAVVLGPRPVTAEASGATRTPHSSINSRSSVRTVGEWSSAPAPAVCQMSPTLSPPDAALKIDDKENNPQATVGSSATTSISTSKSTERLLSCQAARIALLAATAMTAKRKASVALADSDQSQCEVQRLRAVRQPLRTLQTQASLASNQIPEKVRYEDTKKIRKPESMDQSPDKQDPRSALEKRIGAMR